MRCRCFPFIALVVACCERREPPGAEERSVGPAVVGVDDQRVTAMAPAAPEAAPRPRLGSLEDNLPIVPDGTKVASIAWRTWVYTDTGPSRTRYGYLRAGAIVDARGPGLKNEGCAGGWYRINPRGFVCVGKGATLSHEKDPIVRALGIRARRGEGLPYTYVMAGDRPPFLYFRLPTRSEMVGSEGEIAGRVLTWRERSRANGSLGLLGVRAEPPAFLSPLVGITKPYGVKQGLHFRTHAGRAAPDSGFALLESFEWEGRIFGLTSELDIIALDDTRVVIPSTFQGIELSDGDTLPVAVADAAAVPRFSDESAALKSSGFVKHREWVKLTGEVNATKLGLLQTRDGDFVARPGLRVLPPRDSYPSFATGSRKWVDISINQQSLIAYVGQRPVYVTLVSTGRGGLADPEIAWSTVQGTFMIHTKHVSSTMDGDEDDKADSYALRDVPFVQYFHRGYALHGTYWHDEFGEVRSHGCVNLAPRDAAWLFEWTDPVVPPAWHAVLNKERGTVVYVHP